MIETAPAPDAPASTPPARHTLPFLVRYFAREARETPPTFALVEFSHPLQFGDALRELDKALAPAGVPVREIRLTVSVAKGRDASVRQLLAMLDEQPAGALVMVHGFEEVLPADVRERRGVLELFNWYRETIAERPLHQVWWVMPKLAGEMSLFIPDLDSWFLHRLSLRDDEKHALADITASGWESDPVKRTELLARAAELYQRADKLDDAGRYAEAAMLLREVLRLLETILGPEDKQTLIALNLLALTVHKQGNWAGAEPLYHRALEASERTLGPEHPDTLNSLNNLAGLLDAKGDRTGAESLLRRALETRERTLGPEHLDTLTSLNNLAGLLDAKGDRTGAESLLRRALEGLERTLGPEHPTTLTSLNNLAYLLKAEGNLAGAETLYRRALEASERTLGPEHPDTLKGLNNLAYLLHVKGDLAGAELLYRRAAEAAVRLLGPAHPHTQLYRRNLDDLLARTAPATDADAPTAATAPELVAP